MLRQIGAVLGIAVAGGDARRRAAGRTRCGRSTTAWTLMASLRSAVASRRALARCARAAVRVPGARSSHDSPGARRRSREMDGLYRRWQLPHPPIAELLGFDGRWRPRHGRVVFEAAPGEQHYNPIGSVHGGLAATLLDSAMGCAVHTTLPAGTRLYDARAQGELRARAHGATGPGRLRGRGRPSGRPVATAEGRIWERDRQAGGARDHHLPDPRRRARLGPVPLPGWPPPPSRSPRSARPRAAQLARWRSSTPPPRTPR